MLLSKQKNQDEVEEYQLPKGQAPKPTIKAKKV